MILTRKFITLYVTVLFAFTSYSQTKSEFDRVEPAFWWVGMKNAELQILFYNSHTDISNYETSINYPGVSIKEKIKVENPHYLFLNLLMSREAKAGVMSIQFKSGKKSFIYSYELKNKSTAANRIQGFNPSDVLYLIMPDRFANGDV